MRSALVSLLILCAISTSCSLLKSHSRPKGEQVKGTLDKFIKQQNPDASVDSIGNVDFNRSGNYLTVEFQFRDFAYKDDNGAKQMIASGSGTAGYDLNDDGSWILDSVTIRGPGSAKNFQPKMKLE